MKGKLSVFSWLIILVAFVIIAFTAVAQPGGPNGGSGTEPPQPPPEAIAACKGKQAGNSCQISTPQGLVQGTCLVIQDQLVCAPEGGPPGGPPPR